MEKERGSVALMREMLRQGRGFDAEQLAEIHDLAGKAGGAVVALADFDGDWCGTGKIRFPWPPKKGLGSVLEAILAKDVVFDIWRYGQPGRLDGFELTFRRAVPVERG